jgi:NADH dehydrogenase [ubiquinone] 1 alpha subcomplex assembly factor 5
LESFFLCDPSVKNLEISYDRVQKYKTENKMNFSVFPLAVEEEIWPFQDESLDLIITSLSLHWTNDLQVALARQLASLIPDGAMIGKEENL